MPEQWDLWTPLTSGLVPVRIKQLLWNAAAPKSLDQCDRILLATTVLVQSVLKGPLHSNWCRAVYLRFCNGFPATWTVGAVISPNPTRVDGRKPPLYTPIAKPDWQGYHLNHLPRHIHL